MSHAPTKGQIVRVRTRRHLVTDVASPPEPGDQTLVSLACLEDDAAGERLDVLWETELDAAIVGAASWETVAERGFDTPERFAGYMNALRWNSVTATDAELFQAPFRAGIALKAYQLEPLRKALQLPRVNLFIADDVGLGKTIEAGLILRELLMRQKVSRVVVAAPPSVTLQWRDELEQRFGLSFATYDRDFVAGRRRERGYAVNPWTTHPRFIVSHRLLARPEHGQALIDALGDAIPCPGSLLILDEAHNAAPASGQRYAVDSRFTKVIRDLAPRFEHRLFLSATPHNGHSNSFTALLELLDPQRFCRGVPVLDATLRDAVMVRRLKEDLRQMGGGAFPKRIVEPIVIDGLPDDTPELALSRMLEEYRALRGQRIAGLPRRQQLSAGLVMVTLQKRLLSSVEAFHRTLTQHRAVVLREGKAESATPTRDQTALLRAAPGSDDEDGAQDEESLLREDDAAVRAASAASAMAAGEPSPREREMLNAMREIASRSRVLPDARVRWLLDWIREHQCQGLPREDQPQPPAPPAWNDRRLIIFTEYVDTKRYLEGQLRAALEHTNRGDDRIATFTGGMSEDNREAIKRAFNAPPAEHALRILIATDAAREGVNLQNHCADLLHFDLPWNPARIEQRNGRIDRTLQRAPEVFCRYFEYAQRPEDRVLKVLATKTSVIEDQLGVLTPVLEKRADRVLEQGIPRNEAESLARQLEDDELARDDRNRILEEFGAVTERGKQLAEQLQRLETLLKRSQDFMRFKPDAFRGTLTAALGMLGAPGLERGDDDEHWRFPALDERRDLDPGWRDLVTQIREPLERGQQPWQRRENALRPVVFRDPGTLDSHAVHLHLEHPIAQRLLNRFLAQGFVYNDLSRACIGMLDDPIPRVVLLGRLALYGEHAGRLHDELLAVSARWVDLPARRDALTPFAAGSAEDRETQSLLERALGQPRRVETADRARQMLMGCAARDVRELLPHLEQRARERERDARKRLKERGRDEARAMRDILKSQRKRIEQEIERVQALQLELEFPDEQERRQVQADRDHWRGRLTEIARELDSEPARIEAGYEVAVPRFEPVGLVYLWPTSR